MAACAGAPGGPPQGVSSMPLLWAHPPPPVPALGPPTASSGTGLRGASPGAKRILPPFPQRREHPCRGGCCPDVQDRAESRTHMTCPPHHLLLLEEVGGKGQEGSGCEPGGSGSRSRRPRTHDGAGSARRSWERQVCLAQVTPKPWGSHSHPRSGARASRLALPPHGRPAFWAAETTCRVPGCGVGSRDSGPDPALPGWDLI